ncbi:MAG: transporter [Rhodoferax sp.]|nr:transporter [Rhodoferax sp.]
MTSVPSPGYGADDTGLVCGFRFGPEGRGTPVDARQALQWLGQGGSPSGAGFVWLHFNLAQAATARWLHAHLQLSPVFHEALRDGSRSTRIEMDDDMLIAVVNDVCYDFSFEPTDVATLWLSVGPRLVVSARMQPLRAIDRLRESVRRGATLGSSVDMLVHLMHDQGDVLVQIVRETTARVDQLEDRLLAGRLARKRADLGSLRRVLVRLQRLLAPEPAALFRLLRLPPEWIVESDLDGLRQATEEFDVALRDMATLVERIKLLQEDIAGRVAEANNRSLFLLTIVTVLALPVNIMAGLFGMNVGGVPLVHSDEGFWIIVAIAVALTALAGWIAYTLARD